MHLIWWQVWRYAPPNAIPFLHRCAAIQAEIGIIVEVQKDLQYVKH